MSCLQKKKINVEEYYIDGVKQDLVDNTTNTKLRKNSIDMLDNAKVNQTDINKWKDEKNLDDIIKELTKVQTQIDLYNIEIRKNIKNLEQADDKFDTPVLIEIIQRVNHLYKRVELITSGELLLIQEAEDAISNATYITMANANKIISAAESTPQQTTSPTYEGEKIAVCEIYDSIDEIFKKLTTTLTIPLTDFGNHTVGVSVVQDKSPKAEGTLVYQLTGETNKVVVITTSGEFDAIHAISVGGHMGNTPTPTAVALPELNNVSEPKPNTDLIEYAERLMEITQDDKETYDLMKEGVDTTAAERAAERAAAAAGGTAVPPIDFSSVHLKDKVAISNLEDYIMVPNRFKIIFGFENGGTFKQDLVKEFRGKLFDSGVSVTQTSSGGHSATGTLLVGLPSLADGHNTFSVTMASGIFKAEEKITIANNTSITDVYRVEDISLRHADAWVDYRKNGFDDYGKRDEHIDAALKTSKVHRDNAPKLITQRIFVGDGTPNPIKPPRAGAGTYPYPPFLPKNETAFDLYVMGGCSIENKLNKLYTGGGGRTSVWGELGHYAYAATMAELNYFKTSIYCKYTAFCNSIRVGGYGVYPDTTDSATGFSNYTLSVGPEAKATGKNSFALGEAEASGDNTFAVGRCTVSGKNSLGFQSQSSSGAIVGSDNSLSIGSMNVNLGGTLPTYNNDDEEINAQNKIIDIEDGKTWGAKNSVTIGYGNYTLGEASVCIGSHCHTGGYPYPGRPLFPPQYPRLKVQIDDLEPDGWGVTGLPITQYAKVKGLLAMGKTHTSDQTSTSWCVTREKGKAFVLKHGYGARYAAIGFDGNSISIDEYGMVGIGSHYDNGSGNSGGTNTATGRAPLHVFGGNGRLPGTPYGTDGVPDGANVSLRIHGNVFKKDGHLYKSSDERIKKNITDIPGDVSLQMVRDIECKYYEYKDTKLNANKTMGFIAQQVNTVLPTAVSIISEFICSEQRISTEHTWEPYQVINEDTASSVTKYKLTILDLNETSGEQLYRFRVSDNLENGDEEIETISLKDEHNSFIFDKIYEHVFICGKHANDYHVLDYDKVFCLNIPATKEIDRIQQIEKERVSVLEEKTSTMKARLSEIESILANLSTV